MDIRDLFGRRRREITGLRNALYRVLESAGAEGLEPGLSSTLLAVNARAVVAALREHYNDLIAELPGQGASPPVPSVDPAWFIMGGKDVTGQFVMAASQFGSDAPCEVVQLNLGHERVRTPGGVQLRLPKVRSRLTLQYPRFTLIRGTEQAAMLSDLLDREPAVREALMSVSGS